MEHHHEHHHRPADYNRAFIVGIGLNIGFVLVEASYGYLSSSLALLADAGHNLSDVLGLGLAWAASLLARRPSSMRYTYGLGRWSILAALANALVLLFVTGGIAWEAVRRFGHPEPSASTTIIGVALVGIAINSLTAWLFFSGRKNDLNLRGAFLHMLSDALVSFGVVLAGLAMLFTGWQWLDPLMSLVIAGVIVVGTWQLLVDAFNLALDGVPNGIDPETVRTYLAELPGVQAVHDLHIWAMSTTETAMTAHLIIPAGHPGDHFLCDAAQVLHERFAIEHVTLQVELGDPATVCAMGRETHS